MNRFSGLKSFKEIEPLLKVNRNNISEYVNVMLKTRNKYLCNAIAYKLERFKSDLIKHALVSIIRRKSRINETATFIVMCEKYDCSEYLNTFTNIVLMNETESYFWAADVIGKMKGDFGRGSVERNIKKITQAIDSIQQGKKREVMNKILKYLLKYKKSKRLVPSLI